MKNLNAEELKDLLINEGVLNSLGFYGIEFMNIKIKGNNKSAVGYLIQDWLGDWMKSKDIYFSSPTNSQESPDFFLSPNKEINLLEVKAFDFEAGPNFDVANYEAYCRSLLQHPYKIDSSYLIFGYILKDGVFKIQNIWLKKVWEITSRMGDFPIKIQRKQDMIYNIRPAKWYSNNLSEPVFNSKEKFLVALQESLLKYEHTRTRSVDWLNNFSQSYSRIIAKQP